MPNKVVCQYKQWGYFADSTYQSTHGEHESHNAGQTSTLEPLAENGFLDNDNGAATNAVHDTTNNHGCQASVVHRKSDQDIAEGDQDCCKNRTGYCAKSVKI